MSESDLHFGDMHAELFDSFGVEGTVQRGMDLPVPVVVVVDRSVAQYDDNGRVVRRVDLVSFLTAEWQALRNDRVVVPDSLVMPGGFDKKVDTLESDDGFVNKAVMYG